MIENIANSAQGLIPGRTSLISRLFGLLFSQFTSFLLFVASLYVVVLRLGAEGLGLYLTALVILHIITTISSLGLPVSILRFIRSKPLIGKAMAGNSLVISFIWGTIVAGVLLYSGSLIPVRFLLTGDREIWTMLAIAVVPYLLNETSGGLLLGFFKRRLFNFLQFIRYSLLFCGILYFSMSDRLSVEIAIALSVVSCLLIAMIQLFITWYKAGFAIFPDFKSLLRISRFSFQAYLAVLLLALKFFFDFLLTRYFLDSHSVGIYGGALVISLFAWFMPVALTGFIFSSNRRTTQEELNKMRPSMARVGLTLSIVTVILMSIIGWFVFRFYLAPDLGDSYFLSLILAPGFVMYTHVRILSGGLIRIGWPKTYLIINAVCLATGVFLGIVFIPEYGIYATASINFLMNVFVWASYLFFFSRDFGADVADLFAVRWTDWRGMPPKRI